MDIARILRIRGWTGCAMVVSKRPVPGRFFTNVRYKYGQGPTALAEGAGLVI